MRRIFLAIPVGQDPELVLHFNKIRENLQEEKIKWVRAENLHLTLHFFGNTGEEDIRRLDHLLTTHLLDFKGFVLNFNSMGVFPSIRKPRVIWFGLDKVATLDALVNRVEEVLQEGNFMLSDKPFSPHLTLGRIKWIEDRQHFAHLLEDYREKEISRLSVKEIHLYESLLKPDGPVYKIIHRYELM